MKTLSTYLEKYRGVKIYQPPNLFDTPVNWKLCAEGKCSYCGKSLCYPLKRKIALCSRVNCPAQNIYKGGFKISLKKLDEIKARFHNLNLTTSKTAQPSPVKSFPQIHSN